MGNRLISPIVVKCRYFILSPIRLEVDEKSRLNKVLKNSFLQFNVFTKNIEFELIVSMEVGTKIAETLKYV